MAKRLRKEGPCLNDLVYFRNACEERKLKFTLRHIEYLKQQYVKQQDQAQMFFAIKHLAVPLRRKSVISTRNELQEKKRTKSAPGNVTASNIIEKEELNEHEYGPGDLKDQEGFTKGSKPSIAFITTRSSKMKLVNNNAQRGGNTSDSNGNSDGESETENDKFPAIDTKSNTISRKSTPTPKTTKPILRPATVSFADIDSYQSSSPTLNIRSKSSNTTYRDRVMLKNTLALRRNFEIKKDNQLLGRKEAWEFVSQDTNTSTIKEDFKLASHFSNMDLLGDETMTLDDIFLKRRNRKKQMDTEEGDIENESDNKELTSKEKWEESLIRIMRTRKPEYKLSVQELNQRKEEIRQRWQVAYDQVKKNRLVVKNKKVKEQAMQNGVTLVKFLAKSQQAKYIKEAQFQRQYCL